jgi:hypothetical protein
MLGAYFIVIQPAGCSLALFLQASKERFRGFVATDFIVQAALDDLAIDA